MAYQLIFKRKLQPQKIFGFLDKFSKVFIDEEILKLAEDYIINYNLRPNDALILASCKVHKIENLISLDGDFIAASQSVGIKLITSVDDLKDFSK